MKEEKTTLQVQQELKKEKLELLKAEITKISESHQLPFEIGTKEQITKETNKVLL
jgi:hypothetical protein